jgi:hypothetical protein
VQGPVFNLQHCKRKITKTEPNIFICNYNFRKDPNEWVILNIMFNEGNVLRQYSIVAKAETSHYELSWYLVSAIC